MQKALFTILVVAVLIFPSKAQAQDMPPIPEPAMDLAWMHELTPYKLITMVFADLGPASVEKALYIACREGGLDKGSSYVNGRRVDPCNPKYRLIDSQPPRGPACAADNPSSSASGMFQFMGSWAGWGGYNWADVRGPDCLTDVLMAYEVVKTQGWGPWGG